MTVQIKHLITDATERRRAAEGAKSPVWRSRVPTMLCNAVLPVEKHFLPQTNAPLKKQNKTIYVEVYATFGILSQLYHAVR